MWSLFSSPMSITRVAGSPIMARYVRKVFGSSNSFKLSTLTTLMRMSSLYELSTDPSLQILHILILTLITLKLSSPTFWAASRRRRARCCWCPWSRGRWVSSSRSGGRWPPPASGPASPACWGRGRPPMWTLASARRQTLSRSHWCSGPQVSQELAPWW